jgi:putative peptidoglycan lipid II flippase
MIAILLGQLTGLIRGILVARAFGASPELDAFFAANRVSETLFLLVAGGALGSAFIPTFTGLLAKNETDPAWRLASAIGNAVVLTLSLLAGLMAIFAPQVVRYALAPGLSTDPQLFSLTIVLLRIQLISTVLFGLGGLFVGILNAHQIFLIPALTPAMYQLGIIFGAVVLSPKMGVYGLAWGVVVGAILYLLIQVPSLLKLLHPLRPSDGSPIAKRWGRLGGGLGLHNPEVRKVIVLMGPRLLGVAVVQLNFWVNTWLASRMESGSVTGLYYGFSLMLMAQAAIAQSVAIAAMPTFSAQHALGQVDELRSALASSLRGVIFLALPASVGLILISEPLVSLLYQRGEFDQRAVQFVVWPLLWYAGGLVGHSIMEVLTRAYYAQQDTKTPVIIGTIAMGLNVVFSILFSRMFLQLEWLPHGGLALANSLATALEATALFIVIRKRLNGIEGRLIARGFGTAAISSYAMAIALSFWLDAVKHTSTMMITVSSLVVGGVVYLAGMWLFRAPEIKLLTGAVSNRLKR